MSGHYKSGLYKCTYLDHDVYKNVSTSWSGRYISVIKSMGMHKNYKIKNNK